VLAGHLRSPQTSAFQETVTPSGQILYESYDYRLVILSFVFAVLSAHAALDLAGRVTAARRWHRSVWLGGGAVSMGFGIWGMHYIGMLAFSLPVPIQYHYPTVILSLLAAIAAAAVALSTIGREEMNSSSWIVGGLIMSAGIVAMHWIGMRAMRMAATTEYDRGPQWFAVALAVAGSLTSLRLAFHARNEQRNLKRRWLSALIMGSAIALMHYTAMWAAFFRRSQVMPDVQNSLSISSLGIAVISAVILAFLLAAMGTSYLDRLMAAKLAEVAGAKESEQLFRTLAEAVPQITWAAYSDGAHEFFGTRWYDYTGLTAEQSRGSGWKTAVHPDDVATIDSTWKDSSASGKPYEIEYRFRSAEGLYRWFLGRANPIRDEHGVIVKWFGTCTDIEEQKHNQQVLEDEIRQRTEQLADANTRLQEEAWEKDLARRQLDEQHEKMMSELTQRSQRATLLAKMGELLQSCVTKEEVFAAALGFAPKIFPSSRGAVALMNHARSLVEVAGTWQSCEIPWTVFEPSSCWALRTSHPHLVEAGDMTAPCAHASGVKTSYVCVPIMAQGEALGVLHFQAAEASAAVSDSELSFRTTFAGQVGLSVANIRLREALRTQSIKDALTGLYNRRYLEEMLDREIRRAVRASQPLGILMIDVDHFKKFNDTYGHDAGDTVLREAASFFTRSVRVEDIACRFGGEEFVIILPTADLSAAQMRAERIRSKISDLTVLHQGSSLGRITISVGVAGLPMHGTSPKELLEAADAALYRAKKAGRDRVVVAEQPMAAEMATAAISQSAPN
jgi:diguanylate cyclase (GGDEF)-like protein/PAS domain S-box-containing protein